MNNCTTTITVNNRQTVFRQAAHHQTNAPLTEWVGKYQRDDAEEIELELDAAIFEQDDNGAGNIDWPGVAAAFEEIMVQFDLLVSKAKNVLIALHKEIFGNEFEEKDGYFDFTCIRLTSFKRNTLVPEAAAYRFEMIFSLESAADHVLDPYFQYHATCMNTAPGMITLCGVSRE
jgi:hypothetical protein